jgi:hypothetical protein
VLELTGTWALEQKRLNIAQLQRTKAFMPPFGGPALELEALVQLLSWRRAGKPQSWPLSDDPTTLKTIQEWLDQAGARPGVEPMG